MKAKISQHMSCSLTLSMLGKNSADKILKYVSYFS